MLRPSTRKVELISRSPAEVLVRYSSNTKRVVNIYAHQSFRNV